MLLWLITGSLMLQPLSTDLYLPTLPHLGAYFAVSPAAVQQTLSLFVIGFGVAQLVSGPLSDRYGRRPVLLGGLWVYLLSSLTCALAPAMPVLVAARFVQAVGCCTAVVVARALIRDVFEPAEGARMIAKASSLLSAAPLLGPILGGFLQVQFGWRSAFLVLVAFCAALAFSATRWLRETNSAPNPEALRPAHLAAGYRAIAGHGAFWAYTLPGALSYAGIFVFIAGSSFALIQVLGVSTEAYGFCYALGVCGYLGGTLVCRRLLPRLGIDRTLRVGVAVAAAGAVLFAGCIFAGVHHWAVVVAGQFLAMAAHGINFPCAQAGSVAPFPDRAGAAAGLMGAVTMLAALAVGTWVGQSHDGTLTPLAWIDAAAAGTLALAAAATRRHRRAD
ncbi:MAG: multidrug effflux MFS transporter [Rhodocyclaceae bacterium]|nr:multidrug effflux MFS transporter [Rhodocyclaceae bacterium]